MGIDVRKNMKAEINNENKAKFFALYYDQVVLMSASFVKGQDLRIVMNDKDLEVYGKKSYLQLKPLSQITDEDAWEVGIRVNCWSNWERKKDWFLSKDDDFHKVHIFGGQAFANAIGKDFGPGMSHPFANNSTDILCAYDYLRSKGYALPWMGLTIDDMVEAGWIKLIES